MQQTGPGMAGEQGEKMELFFSALNLQNQDGMLGKSDPHLQLWEMTALGGLPKRMIGKTEVIKNNLNPTWSTTIEYFFVFESQQFLQIRVLDTDAGKDDDDPIGIADLQMVDIITKSTEVGYEIELKGKGVNSGIKKGKVRIKFDRIGLENQLYTIEPILVDIQGGCCSRNDYLIKISRPADAYLNTQNAAEIPPTGWITVHETEHYPNKPNPRFMAFDITGAKLCKNNLATNLKFEIFDFRDEGFNVSLGSGFANLTELVKGQATIATPGGKIAFGKFLSVLMPSMVDLVRQGMQMSLYVAIDFTGSNGLATSPASLHYMNPNLKLNGYESVITSVGSILQEYDSKKQFPVYGFGATFPPAGIT